MKAHFNENLLLKTELARRLYHEHAAPLPIIDYHSHVNPRDLADDRTFADMVQLWIAPDQYKHRAMRALGMPERGITGDAPPHEKFAQWAAAVPQLVGSPLFQWTALELKAYFGVSEPLNPASAAAILEHCNAQLTAPTHTARRLLERARVAYLCTSDRLLDDLEAHAELARSGWSTRVVPSLRADDALAVESPAFPAWVRDLGATTGGVIASLDAFEHALDARLAVFAAHGCDVSDHGLDVFGYTAMARADAASLFARRIGGETLTAGEAIQLRSHVLTFLAKSYARRGWIMQLHLGAQRQTSTRLRTIAGPAGGFAAIGGTTDIASLCRLFDDLEQAGGLPRTILYNLNPVDNVAYATITGSFTEEGVAGKIQFGPAWWFNDHAAGMRAHLDAISHYGLLVAFIGMTTDSRSLLSMTRHDYFRRVLCDYIGDQVAAGAWPADEALLATYVRRIGYENARDWLLPRSTQLP